VSDLDMRARETWWSLCQMSYTGDQPDLRKQDVEEIASLIRDLAADARQLAETREALADGARIAAQFMDTGRGDLDGWIDRARRHAVSPADTTEAG